MHCHEDKHEWQESQVDQTHSQESGLKAFDIPQEQTADVELVVEHMLQDAEVEAPFQGARENHSIRYEEGRGPPGQSQIQDILETLS